jgi:superfamily II DNA or RNA helicase
LTATLPLGVNPWVTLPLAIASIDYVKRPEVLPAVMSCAWDLVIVDEAHGVVGDSERFAAVRSLAARSPYVLLLTATPHSGDEKAFAALCGLGDLHTSDRIVVFRRTRQSFGCGAGRRLVTLNVRPSARERSMFDALARYRRAVQAEHGERALALSVLDKRAYSSAWSLAVSVARRLAELANSGAGGVDQPWLPFDDPDGELTHEDVAPAWPADLDLADSTCERALLTAIAEAAQAAVRQRESKIDALRRLLRRCRESAIVFTEFRDTALHVSEAIGHVPVLHGGLTSTERTRIVDRFTSGERAVLVATDAAGQGLNLHHRCRLVINLELPWNPARIEQRIGRVERIGQKRRVHGVLLVGRSTGEHRILARLRQRTATASRSMEPAAETTAESRSRLVADAAVEAARLMSTRRFDRREDDGILAKLEESRWWTSKARKWRTRSALAGRSVHIYRLTAVDAAGGIAASEVIAVAVRVEPRHSEENAVVADHLLQHWQTTVRAASAAYWNTRVRRERLIVTAADPPSASPLQASLFNHRDERTHVAARVAQQAWLDAARLRLVETERQSLVRSTTAELLLVLAP